MYVLWHAAAAMDHEVPGAFGTSASLALRLGQTVFSIASLIFMCLDVEFYRSCVFCLQMASMLVFSGQWKRESKNLKGLKLLTELFGDNHGFTGTMEPLVSNCRHDLHILQASSSSTGTDIHPRIGRLGALVYVSRCILLGCERGRLPARFQRLLLQRVLVQPIPTVCRHGHLVLVSRIQLLALQPVASSISVNTLTCRISKTSCSGHLIWKPNVIAYIIVQNMMSLQQSFKSDQFNLFLFIHWNQKKPEKTT
nr:CASP-like protein ARALYDRAFT_485429 [Ipomoea batatas]